jgi:hypothetical protein
MHGIQSVRATKFTALKGVGQAHTYSPVYHSDIIFHPLFAISLFGQIGCSFEKMQIDSI